MRSIKFRAWDKVEQEMFNPETENNNEMFFVGLVNGKLRCSETQYDDGDDFILMQYTGLTDKNGKEIYEGDVLQLAHPFKDRQYTGKVIFERGSFIAEDFWMTHYDNPSDFTEGLEHVEVIGNIYEHPHLLEESK